MEKLFDICQKYTFRLLFYYLNTMRHPFACFLWIGLDWQIVFLLLYVFHFLNS